MSETKFCPTCKRTYDFKFQDCPFCDTQYKFIRENASKDKVNVNQELFLNK